MSEKTKFWLKVSLTTLAAAIAAFLAAAGLSSCSAVRTVSTQSSYIQHGDTTTTITVKTVEKYDARKNSSL